MTTFSELIRTERRRNERKLPNVAREAGIDARRLWRIEEALDEPTGDEVMGLAYALNLAQGRVRLLRWANNK